MLKLKNGRMKVLNTSMVFFYLATYLLTKNHGMGLVNISKSFELCYSFKILQMRFECVRPSEIPVKHFKL